MKYRLNTTNYHTFEVYEDNKLAPRSYFIPFFTRDQADAADPAQKRYCSPKISCLSGSWDFKFYPVPTQLSENIDTDQIDFDTIDVPSCWQFRGYDKPFYVNTRYQFPYNPPQIPTLEKVSRTFSWMGVDKGVMPRFQTPVDQYNFLGLYRKKILIEEGEENYILSFLGAASCLDLYVNGAYAGYSEGSHNIAEFDITRYLHPGENELLVLVHRWCNGTYLEAQDMFRNNGIFRDVLLWKTLKSDVWDLDFQTKYVEDGIYTATVTAQLYQDKNVTFTLEGENLSQSLQAESQNKKAQVLFENLKVQEWTAENPVLYTLYCQTKSCCIKTQVGFRRVTIEGDLFKVNGKLVKFHGVNHHDTSPVNGYTMTLEELERDVKICKEYNIDTIRMSHYPPDPYMLELCDRYGIYVVDETDLETHGVFSQQLPPTYNSISNDPKWADHYVDRVSRMYQRDKMHVSIVMWSLGNESGGYFNTDKEYDYLKAHTEIPVHYESAIHCKRIAYDVGSQMYPSVAQVASVGNKTCKTKKLLDRPYFLCEYAHAMGVGPGNMESYWKEIYSHDNLMGGCVWEMVDHAVLHEDGSYTYGGDHGEWEHDSNFCVDGIFYPDRRPSTGAHIVKYIYRPLRITHLQGDEFEVFNTTAFTNGNVYLLKCTWSDGSSKELQVDVKPLEKKTVILTPDTKAAEDFVPLLGSRLLTIEIIDSRTGEKKATEQILLKKKPVQKPNLQKNKPLPEDFDIVDGRPHLKLENGELCAVTPYNVLFRAATDNDTDATMRNTMKPYYNTKEKVIGVHRQPGSIKVVTEVRVNHNVYSVTDIYSSLDQGILVTSRIRLVRGFGYIPRFGKAFRLDQSFDRVTYQGRSGESYVDMKDQFPVEKVSCTVADMTEPNIRPQESGNRCDTSYVILESPTEKVMISAVGNPFELSVKPYSDVELISMKHRQDEIRTGTYVTINAFQMGIGTGSCGPTTQKEFKYSAKEDYVLQFIIRKSKV